MSKTPAWVIMKWDHDKEGLGSEERSRLPRYRREMVLRES